MRILAGATGAGLLLVAIHVLAKPYHDCILQYMGNARDRDARDAIELACLSKGLNPSP
jgi:hypothetical protein